MTMMKLYNVTDEFNESALFIANQNEETNNCNFGIGGSSNKSFEKKKKTLYYPAPSNFFVAKS